MIIKDTSVYLNYIQDIENKVNNLRNNCGSVSLSNEQKQSVEKNLCPDFFQDSIIIDTSHVKNRLNPEF